MLGAGQLCLDLKTLEKSGMEGTEDEFPLESGDHESDSIKIEMTHHSIVSLALSDHECYTQRWGL